jgi:hypothetical protein
MRKRTDNDRPGKEEEVILLEDLAPRKDVKGGSGKVLFGQEGVARGPKGGGGAKHGGSKPPQVRK